MAEALLVAPPRILLCVDLADSILSVIRDGAYRLVTECSLSNLSSRRSDGLCADVVLIDVSAGSESRIEAVRRARSAICMAGSTTSILCFSVNHRNPRFVLEVMKCGARYVRVGNPAMLVEAVEILLAETAQTLHSGPCFRIRHRFSLGSCAPGEEISVIELLQNGISFQLPLSLSSRLLFNYIAENRTLALDAFQIASGLNGWFYREHGLNGGVRQTAKVRVARVKVLVQRIRRAMAATFEKAALTCNAYDVLRSFPAEGSKRALYRLRADIRWDHQFT